MIKYCQLWCPEFHCIKYITTHKKLSLSVSSTRKICNHSLCLLSLVFDCFSVLCDYCFPTLSILILTSLFQSRTIDILTHIIILTHQSQHVIWLLNKTKTYIIRYNFLFTLYNVHIEGHILNKWLPGSSRSCCWPR